MRTLSGIPALLQDVADAQEGLLASSQCERHGVGASRRSRLVAAGRWHPVTRGVFDVVPVLPRARTAADAPRRAVPPLASARVPLLAPWPPKSSGDVLHGHLRRRTAWLGLLAYGPDAIAVGTSALAMHGVEGLPIATSPQAALPSASRRAPRPGVPLRQFDDGLSTVEFGDRRTGSRRIVTAEWALAQAVPELPLAHALAVLDSALRLEAVDRRGLERSHDHDHARGRRGVAARHDLWDLADPRAASPIESMARWQCLEEGVPPDTLQLPLRGRSGRLLAVGDLAWRIPGGWLVVEMDGRAWHDDLPGGDRRDRDRDNTLTVLGVHLLRFDAGHVARGEVGTAVRRALGAARRTGG
ncbi:hypothetical protein ACH436_08695 [Isoptericola sp. NPDC019693]|uniref:hypothetical protein n=1 Tax=Isoptericola sp. NPDC019693 TaxID=3364009 RepID=UPI00379E99AC